MTTFFTSDWHINHRNILIYCAATRPFKDIDHMSCELIERHNSVVKDGDLVYHVGDFSFSEMAIPTILPRLHGSHILVPGNHDKCWHGHKKHEGAVRRYIGYGFKEVLQETTVGPFLVNHMPYIADDRHGERYAQYRPNNEGRPLLHGHTHNALGKIHGDQPQIDIGIDSWNCTPVAFETLLEIIK
jgi:calcineurin-like phosphoesterase family protein